VLDVSRQIFRVVHDVVISYFAYSLQVFFKSVFVPFNHWLMAEVIDQLRAAHWAPQQVGDPCPYWLWRIARRLNYGHACFLRQVLRLAFDTQVDAHA